MTASSSALRATGLRKLVSFYRYFAFDLPRTTTAAGVVLLGGVAAIRLSLLLTSPRLPGYLVAYFVLIVAAAALGMAGVLAPRRMVARIGWAWGSVVALVSWAVYVTGRTVGLPGLPQLVGRWEFPLGTVAMVLSALYLALHFSVLTGMNVAVPDRRGWHD